MTYPKGETILCIGNGPIELNLRCALLHDHGWHVLSAGRGQDGIRRFGKEIVDAVVLDFNGDGAEAALIASQLKRQRSTIPIVLIVDGENTLAPGAIDQADAVVLKAEERSKLVIALRKLLKSA